MDTAAMMSANASAWLYGSYARGDHDEHSDLDVLVVGSDQKKNWHDDFVSAIQKQEVKMSIACYRWGDVESMKSYGSIFLYHLQAEAKPIWEGAHVHGRLREMLVTLPPYGYVPRDILIYRQAVADVRRSLLGGGYVPFELSLLATTLRHAAVLGCYIIQRPNFGRVSAIEAYTRQSGLKAWTSRKVKRLVDYKLWSEGRRAAPKHISLERSALTLCDEVWALIDAVEGDAAWRGLIAA